MIDPELKECIINKIKFLKDNQYSLSQMQNCIEKQFDCILSLKTISNYVSESQKDEWVKKLAKQNEIMRKWMRECEPQQVVNEVEEMAERLYNQIYP